MKGTKNASREARDDRRERVLAKFRELYGDVPEGWVRAPGRAELLGSDTDDHLGYVLTMSIDLDTWIAFRSNGGDHCRVYSLNLEQGAEFSCDAVSEEIAARWDRYVSGVADALIRRGLTVPGVNAVIHGTVPVGGGLSSSASLEVATAQMFMAAGGNELEPKAVAVACQEAENRSVGVNCGILDQYTSALGRADTALLLDCRALSHAEIALPTGIRIVVCDTNYPRTLAGSAYAQRRAECDEATRLLRAIDPSIRTLRDVNDLRYNKMSGSITEPARSRGRFIVEENLRVIDFTAALLRDDRPRIGAITERSFSGFRDLYGKTVPAMEHMYAAMTAAPGVIGARQGGGGFGGCLVAFVEVEKIDAFCESVLQDYKRRSGLDASVYPTSAADGAEVMTFDEQ